MTALQFIQLVSDAHAGNRVSHLTVKDGDAYARVGGVLSHGYKFRPETSQDRDALIAWLQSLRFDTEPPGV